MSQTKKNEFNKRMLSLRNEYQQWKSSWMDLSRYVAPKRGQFEEGNQSKLGDMIDHKLLLDGHATRANRILASGLSNGMTSKSRPWFKLSIENKAYMEIQSVKVWLDSVERLLYDTLEQSNLYGVFNSTYEELGAFGTGCYIILEDFEKKVIGRNFTIGEYYLGIDARGRVNTFGRKFPMTVAQMIEEFGEENCPSMVVSDYRNNQVDNTYIVNHLIEPNTDQVPGMADPSGMPYRSAYWMDNDGTDKFLAMRGYKRFQVVAPRWDTVTTKQVYGYAPGWDALGDVKQTQKTVKDKLLAQEKLHNPPVQKDASVSGNVNLLPGGVTTTSANVPSAGVRAAYEINPNLESFIELIQSLKDAIDRFFYVNVFLMLMNIDKTNMTATEVAERQQEKVMMLGPILHRLDTEMLTPTLEIVYGILEDLGEIPEPPQEIQGVEIKIQYVSILAQAQKALGVTQIERMFGFIGAVAGLGAQAGLSPEVVDVIDWDETVRQVADMEGVPAKIVRDVEVVAQIRKQRQQQQQAAMAAEMANSAADTTKKLSESKMNEGSALDGLVAGLRR